MSPRTLGIVALRLLGLLLLYQAAVAWLPKLVAFSFGLPMPTRIVLEQLAQWLVSAAPPLLGGLTCLVFAPRLARWLTPADAASDTAPAEPRVLLGVGLQLVAAWVALDQLGPLTHAWLDWRSVATNPRISPELLALTLPPLERTLLARAAVVAAALLLLLLARPAARLLAPRGTGS